jgi:saccharopine dehydrogenase-like NADP-dependent oxidoreductase
MKHVLILGAGLVSAPIVRYFLSSYDWRLTIAADHLQRLDPIIAERTRARGVIADLSDRAALTELMRDADVVVNLLPATMLPYVCEVALDVRRHVISTSYIPPEVVEMNDRAVRNEILILGEVGFDPGLDHMTTVRVIRRLRNRGGRVTHYASCAGGFPALDANNNPWGYKFSWSPRAVVLAARSPARYLRNGEVVEIPGPELFAHCWRREIEGAGLFEIYANRDSLAYIEPYRLQGVEGIFRGTIRRPGWSATMHAAADLGLFDQEPLELKGGATWCDVFTRLVPKGAGSTIRRVAGFLGVEPDSDVITRFEWAGFFSDRVIEHTNRSPLDLFVHRLESLMHYRPGERDMIAMQHQFRALFPDGRIEDITSWLVREGESWGDSAMSQTVSIPAAIAARRVAFGEIAAVGVRIPVTPEIAYPILDELEMLGIDFQERVVTRFESPIDYPGTGFPNELSD